MSLIKVMFIWVNSNIFRNKTNPAICEKQIRHLAFIVSFLQHAGVSKIIGQGSLMSLTRLSK